MLYFYKSISPQPIENLHLYLDFYFSKLFAEVCPTYDHAYYIHGDFKDIVDKYKDQIDDQLSSIFTIYMNSLPDDKQKVQTAYANNNNIEGICNNLVRPYKFDELPDLIIEPLKKFYNSTGILYKMLTSKIAYQTLKDKCGDLKTHFINFRKVNKYSVCPFCGMENLLTEYDDSKNEYDHYISKGDYPFCSINFNNLVPICDYCNKAGNKGQKDIPFIPNSNPQVQEVLFYPYCELYPNHEIALTVRSTITDLSDINSWALDIDCTPAENLHKKLRWIEIYNIENRYKSKITSDSYQWKERIVSKYYLRCKKHNDTFEKFKEDILDDFKEYKKYNNAILMKCFYEFIVNDDSCESYLKGDIII